MRFSRTLRWLKGSARSFRVCRLCLRTDALGLGPDGLERLGGRSRPAPRHLASLLVADALARELTRGSIRIFLATAETEKARLY
jgi:hypothetical protein